jgi:hypothetical protein
MSLNADADMPGIRVIGLDIFTIPQGDLRACLLETLQMVVNLQYAYSRVMPTCGGVGFDGPESLSS